MLLGAQAMETLRGSNVAVFGLGGVGSWCAEALARTGIGRLTLIDQDTVGESNLNRQVCALHSTVRELKATVMAARIRDISPDIALDVLPARYEAATREAFLSSGTTISRTALISLPASSISSRPPRRAGSRSFRRSVPGTKKTRSD
jgi:tRNA A37 threonylcarbamoyladenosine dehydratase